MVVEVIGGIISGSLALLADAAHMFADTVSLLFAWIAFILSRRPADHARTYGYHRFPVLVAYTNGVFLVIVVAWIFFEAVDRMMIPAPILPGPMLVVAVLGLLVNIAAFAVLLEGVPGELVVQEIGRDLVSTVDVVEDVHHVHAWSLSQDHSLLTLHARILENAHPDSAIAAIQSRLASRFDISHVTVQIEVEVCTDEHAAAPA